MTAVMKQDTLHEAVRALADSGCTDPAAILATLSEEYGQAWLLRQLVNVIASIASPVTYARHNEVVTTPGVPRVQHAADDADVFDGSIWVAGRGWIALKHLTASDCRIVADHYGRLAQAAERHRDWFLFAADLIETRDVTTVGDVRALLRPLAPLALTEAVA